MAITVDGEPLELGPDEIAVSLEAREGFAAAAGAAGVVVLHTALTDALVEEGLFREVLNRVQTFRKELDLEYTGRIRLTLEGADRLLSAVRSRKDVLARPVHPKSVEVSIESDAELLGDEAMVQSAFSNLVDNAAKYTPPDGSMSIRWWTDEQGGHFAVRDTGPGIPGEHLPRLTERFYRVDPGRSRETGGSGLGLAIVKHALYRHGARLEIQSTEGRGSTFSCHFPPERVLARRVAQVS